MTEPRRVVLELDEASDPISGVLAAGNAAPLRFSGWLELAGLIEAAASPPEPQPQEEPR